MTVKHAPRLSKFRHAWLAGWDAALTSARCPYRRSEFVRAFQRGYAACKNNDVAALSRYTQEPIHIRAAAEAPGGQT